MRMMANTVLTFILLGLSIHQGRRHIQIRGPELSGIQGLLSSDWRSDLTANDFAGDNQGTPGVFLRLREDVTATPWLGSPTRPRSEVLRTNNEPRNALIRSRKVTSNASEVQLLPNLNRHFIAFWCIWARAMHMQTTK